MKIKYLIFTIASLLLFIMGACTPDDHSLGNKDLTTDDLVEGIAYTVEPDADNPNLIHLKSLLPSSYTVRWDTPQGYSQEPNLDLKMAFAGTYEVSLGVETRGGLVFGPAYTFTIDNFYADFVTGEMWENLTGGAGNSRIWVADNGNYGKQQGFYTCFDPSTTWDDMTNNDGKTKWTTESKTWWEPSNSDIGNTEDDLKGYMEFSLKGKAGLTTHKFVNGVETVTEGIFDMNTDTHTLSATNVEIHHGAWADGKAVDFSKGFQILVLTEDQLMIGNYRDEALSGEGRCVYCWNFVSKDYADSYVPPAETPKVTLPDGWYDKFTTQNKYCSWKLDADVPFDWCDLTGERKNSYKSNSDYPASFTPASDVSSLTLKFCTPGSDGYKVTLPSGTEIAGQFDVSSETGSILFNQGVGSYLIGGSSIYFEATYGANLQVLSLEEDDLGHISDIWLGYKEEDAFGNSIQYLAYHFTAVFGGEEKKTYKATLNYFSTGWGYTAASDPLYLSDSGTYTATINGADSSPYGLYLDINKILKDYPNLDIVIKGIKVDGNDVAFDDSSIDRGIADSSDDARRYIVNPWGATSGDASKYVFSSTIEVEFELKLDNGSPFVTSE